MHKLIIPEVRVRFWVIIVRYIYLRLNFLGWLTGLEPATFSSTGRRSARWATATKLMNLPSFIHVRLPAVGGKSNCSLRTGIAISKLITSFFVNKCKCGKEQSRTAISCFSDTRRDHLGYLAIGWLYQITSCYRSCGIRGCRLCARQPIITYNVASVPRFWYNCSTEYIRTGN